MKASTLALLLMLVASSEAYTPWNPNHSAPQRGSHRDQRSSHRRRRRERLTMYRPPSGPTSQTAPMIAQKMLKGAGVASTSSSSRTSELRLSPSVLASCDTLPSFQTAHGILSPETVSRMDTLTNGGASNEAVGAFLKTYHRNGPMSCLGMLSDPEILPHLTQAMRDVI